MASVVLRRGHGMRANRRFSGRFACSRLAAESMPPVGSCSSCRVSCVVCRVSPVSPFAFLATAGASRWAAWSCRVAGVVNASRQGLGRMVHARTLCAGAYTYDHSIESSGQIRDAIWEKFFANFPAGCDYLTFISRSPRPSRRLRAVRQACRCGATHWRHANGTRRDESILLTKPSDRRPLPSRGRP